MDMEYLDRDAVTSLAKQLILRDVLKGHGIRNAVIEDALNRLQDKTVEEAFYCRLRQDVLNRYGHDSDVIEKYFKQLFLSIEQDRKDKEKLA